MKAPADTVLRSLDPAAPTLTPDERERAAATLERIVATPPSTATAPPRIPGQARRRRRVVLVLAAALAPAVAAVLADDVGDGDEAYASWSATPASVAAHDLEAAAAACRKDVHRFVDLDEARVVLAERRGDHVVLLYRTEDPDLSAPCLVRIPAGSADVDDVQIAAGGSTGPALKAPPRGYTEGAISQFGGITITDGAVGDQVTGVTIQAGALTVQASVQNGRYAAWWPGSAFESGPPAPDGEGDPRPILTYDLTLADGTVIRDARATRPS